jgi:Protein of unknown function (DUF2939)
MRRLLIIVVLLALVGFYVAWPAWSGWQIKNALDQRSPELLASKVDFPSVRAGLKPIVAVEVQKRVEQALAELGPAAALLGPKLREELAPKLAEAALNSAITPDGVIRIAAEGGSIKDSIEKVLKDQTGRGGLPKMGGGTDAGAGQRALGGLPGGLGGILGGAGDIASKSGVNVGGILGGGNSPVKTVPNTPSPAEPATKAAEPAKFGMANVKRLAMTGLASFEVGVARDPKASEADVTATIAFTGGDWKVVSIRPKI